MSHNESNLIEFADLRLDLNERLLWKGGELISLAPKVLETLCILVEQPGRLVSKDELMGRIWPDSFVEERNLTQNVFLLRKLLGTSPDGKQIIETIPRRGYRFTAETNRVGRNSEETFAVTHSRQMHITAEGSVSSRDLTDTVREIARSFEPETRTVAASTQRNRTYVLVGFAAVLLVLIAAGFGFRNGYLGFLTESASSEKTAPVVDYELLTESGNAFFPAISPDNQYVAYVINESGRFRIVLQHLATRSTTEVVSPREYALRSPQFSTDGNYLFYGARDGKMSITIYRVPIFGGGPEQIATNVNQNFSISTDGRRLAFFRHAPEIDGNHLIEVGVEGGGERIVTSLGGTAAFRVWGGFPAWSPDDKKIVAAVRNILPAESGESTSHFVEIDVADGTQKKLKAPAWHIAFQAYWLPDGSGLIAQAQDRADSFFQLYRVSYPDGVTTPVTNDTNNYTEFRVSRDGKMLVTTEEKAPYNLQIISADEPSQVRPLTDSAAVQRGYLGLDWTPDGKELVYVQLEGLAAGNIWKMNVETRESRQLTFDKEVWNRYPSITPDGSIVFSSNRSGSWHIWRMNPDGSNLRQITDGQGENFPQVSADGRWLVYAAPPVTPKVLWKRPLEGGESEKLLDGALGISSISPDGTHVIAGYYDSNEKVKDPWKYVLLPFEPGHQPRETGVSTQHHTIHWRPDGTGIYHLSHGQSHTNIWLYTPADGSRRAVTNFDSHEIAGLSVSPDGKLFAVARGKRASNLIKISGF